MFKAVNLVDS